MARTTSFELPVDTSMFTPLQLHPRTVCWLAMSGWARWLREHWVPFPRLIRDYGLGVVVVRLDLEYLRPFSFFDSDAVVATASLGVRPSGSLLHFAFDLAPAEGGEEVARAAVALRPLNIGEGEGLSAIPTNLDPEVIAGFAEDEIVESAAPPRLRALAADLESGRAPIAGDSHTFTLYRHLCETADQWSFMAVTDVTTEVREKLIAGTSAEVPALTAALRRPMRRVSMEFHGAAFFLDELTAECRAYDGEDELLFVHRFSSGHNDEPLATFVEWFPAEDPRPHASAEHVEAGAST
jgi:acyl-CoA thioesterase FadM